MIIITILALALLIGISIAFGKIAYLETMLLWEIIRPFTLRGIRAIKRLTRVPARVRGMIAQYKHGKYVRERLPLLKKQSRMGDTPQSTWAIAERLNHIKHVRYQEKEDEICG